MSDAADILRKAKELIETKGWCQFAFGIDEGGTALLSIELDRAYKICAEGAIVLAGAPVTSNKFTANCRLVNKAIGRDDDYLSDWNDAEDRTKEEVLSAFDRAIALAEAGQ